MGIAQLPLVTCQTVNIVQCLDLQVIRQVFCLEYAYIYLLVIMLDLYTYAC